MPENLNGFLRFDEYEIDRAKWQLRHRGEVLPVNRKTFDLLLYLAEHADRVVSKDELLKALWPDSFVEESNLTQHIFLLRKALSRHPSTTKIIETVPGRGYRFAVPVEMVASAPPASPVQPSAPAIDPLPASPTLPEEPQLGPDTKRVQEPAARPATIVPKRREGDLRPKRDFSSPILWSLLLTAAVVLLAALYFGRSKAPTLQSISTYQQITHDGHAKWLGGTDGSRIYFTQADRDEVAQISISGGAEAPLPLAIRVPRTGQVSPNGSTLLIISQADGQGPANTLWSVQLIGGSYRRLGNAVSAAWSPDGERIVCASAGGDLYVIRSDGSDKHQIASPGGYVMSLAWSPDGKIIRFTKDGLLWQVSPEGRDLRQLLPGWGKSPTQLSGEWSPDGNYFFVADGQIWELAGARGADDDKAPDPVQLTFGPMLWDRPVPSLDGKTLFASGRVRRGELVRFDPKSTHLEPFLGGISAEFVTFSANRRYVAYVTYPEGRLWRADPDGSNPMQLTSPPVHPKSICWSPDGTQIAFVDRTKNNIDGIFLIAVDGTGPPQRLLPDDRLPETDPSWSPDGKQIAFATSPNVGASAKSDLRIFDIASGKTNVLPASDGLLAPRWSPDGRVLAAMPLDTQKLELLDLSSGRPSALTTGHVAFPEWSRDGKWIYYVGWDPDAALMRIHPTDGKREVLTPLGAVSYTGTYTLWMGLDPGDNPMMLRDEGSDDIYALTLKDRPL